MKLKQLESLLEDVEVFEDANYMLEQYPTTPRHAANMVWLMEENYGDVEGKVVLDLGCGCGILSIASVMMGSGKTIGVDIDESALEVARRNLDEFEMDDVVDLVHCDVSDGLQGLFLPGMVDTVVMNPPFGTRVKGIDMVFLRQGVEIASTAVYSLHKTSTREHIAKKAKQWGCTGTVIGQLRFPLANVYKFHRKKEVDVDVDLWRLDVSKKTLD